MRLRHSVAHRISATMSLDRRRWPPHSKGGCRGAGRYRQKSLNCGRNIRSAYTTSRFPKLSETFILNEIIEIERLGSMVELFPLQREDEPVVHSEAREWVRRAHYCPFLSLRVVAAQLHWLRTNP